MINTSKEYATGKALRTFHEIIKQRSGNDSYTFTDIIGGYRGLSERIAGDAFNKIDFMIYDIIKSAKEGANISIPYATLSNVRHSNNRAGHKTCEVTVLDAENEPKFRLKWTRDTSNNDTGLIKDNVTMSECPKNDPEYPYSNQIASAMCLKKNGGYQSSTLGHLSYFNFSAFISAINVIRPLSEQNLPQYDYGKPYLGLDISKNELDLTDFISVINFDKGLPGEACQEVVDEMMTIGAENSFPHISNQIGKITQTLENINASYGDGVLVFNDLDDQICSIPTSTNMSAILHTNTSLFATHNTFIAYNTTDNNGEPETTTLIALKQGEDTTSAVSSIMKGENPQGKSATFTHSTKTVHMSREFVETQCLESASFTCKASLEILSKPLCEDAKVESFSETERIHGLNEETDETLHLFK